MRPRCGRLGGVTRIPLSPFAVRVWLKRRERRLERAAAAAFDKAAPVLSEKLEDLLAPQAGR